MGNTDSLCQFVMDTWINFSMELLLPLKSLESHGVGHVLLTAFSEISCFTFIFRYLNIFFMVVFSFNFYYFEIWQFFVILTSHSTYRGNIASLQHDLVKAEIHWDSFCFTSCSIYILYICTHMCVFMCIYMCVCYVCVMCVYKYMMMATNKMLYSFA